nr:hypothetical protein [Tanacetum cinerariifolium]
MNVKFSHSVETASGFSPDGVASLGGEGIEGDEVLNWMSSGVIGERLLVDGDVEEVGDLILESMEDKKVAAVDGVFKGAFRALGDKTWFGNRSSSGFHRSLWWLINDEEDDEVVIMPPTMTTQSVGRPAATSRGWETGGRAGRGGGRTRGHSDNQGDGRNDGPGGQVGGQGSEVNGG